MVDPASPTAGQLWLSTTTSNVLKYADNAATPATHTLATFDQVIQASQGGFASNTGFGTGALANNSGDSQVSAFGYQAANLFPGNPLHPGNTITAFGYQAGKNYTAAGATSTLDAFGYQALLACTSGIQNVAIGNSALVTLTTGSFNTAVGTSALQFVTTTNNNTGIGTNAGLNIAAGGRNTVVGFSAMGGNSAGATTTNDDCAFGYQALYNDISTSAGSENSAFGSISLQALTTGAANSAFGKAAVQHLTTGSFNTGLGWGTLNALVTGSNNVALGAKAGINYNTSETNNICIGYNVGGTAGESNVVRIGNSSHTNYFLGSGPAAFATGDKYLIFNPTTKEIHLSSLGPAS